MRKPFAGRLLRAATLTVMVLLPLILARPARCAESAQTQPGAQGGVEEVIVTARRREESLQNVPVAVSVLSAEQIQKYDMTSLETMATQIPELTIGRASNGSGAQLTLRGIGSSSTSIGIEQSVAVILDGVYYGQGRIINEGFMDLAGVEVLKGPQALFFGKNATAGVISLRTADPTPSTELMARVGGEFTADQLLGEAVASIPLSDTLGLRVAFRGSQMYGGYFRNGGTDKTYDTLDIATGVTTPHFAPALTTDNPGTRELLGRVTLQYKPTDRLTATLKISADSNDNDNNSWNYVPIGCAGPTFSLNPQIKCARDFTIYQNFFPAGLAGANPFSRPDGGLYNDYQSWATTGTLDYDLGAARLTWVSNFNRDINQWACDCTLVSSNLAAAPSTELSIFDAYSSELRLQSNFDGPLNLLAGLYFQKTHRNHTQTGSFANLEDSTQPLDRRYLAYLKRSETHGKTVSGYGQATWKVVPDVELAGGARYTYETKDSYIVQPYVIAPLQAVFLQNVLIPGNQTFRNWSPEATLTWTPTRDLTVYGAFKTAYKSGGFSNSGFVSATTIPSDLAFNPEKARGFEAGIKTTWLDRQLRLNVDAYTYKYIDLQVDFFNSQTFAFITTNAGSVRTQGFEGEAEYAPRALSGLNLHGTFDFNRARYLDYIAPCYSGQSIVAGCNTTFQGSFGQNLSGKPTAVAPDWTASLGAAYERALDGGFRLGLSVDSRYSSSYLASAFANPLSRQPRYVLIDASARVRTDNDRYELAVIGKNLTNRFIIGGAVDAPNTGSGTGTNAAVPADELGFINLPRTVELQATMRF